MRACLRCQTVMVEDLSVMVTNGAYGVEVREKGLFRGSLGKLKCAICPKCGYAETYLNDTERIQRLFETGKR